MAHVSLGFRFWCRICSQDGKKHRGRHSSVATKETGCGCGWSPFGLFTLCAAPSVLTGGCPHEARVCAFQVCCETFWIRPPPVGFCCSFLNSGFYELLVEDFQLWSSKFSKWVSSSLDFRALESGPAQNVSLCGVRGMLVSVGGQSQLLAVS